ncbi:MAG: hypothetical protein NTW26_08820, partial [bacterium]|nr:hypothetical protein [bacterium]
TVKPPTTPTRLYATATFPDMVCQQADKVSRRYLKVKRFALPRLLFEKLKKKRGIAGVGVWKCRTTAVLNGENLW